VTTSIISKRSTARAMLPQRSNCRREATWTKSTSQWSGCSMFGMLSQCGHVTFHRCLHGPCRRSRENTSSIGASAAINESRRSWAWRSVTSRSTKSPLRWPGRFDSPTTRWRVCWSNGASRVRLRRVTVGSTGTPARSHNRGRAAVRIGVRFPHLRPRPPDRCFTPGR
jgi:hypothetical protein